MKTIDIEKLNQLVSRTDISGNDKVRWLTDFIDGREFQLQERSYSEEEVFELIKKAVYKKQNAWKVGELDEWFKQFKKK
jgi:hypothetical protein